MLKRKAASSIVLAVLFTFVLTSGFVCTASQQHRATVAEHDFKITIQNFQEAEIAEFMAGHVDVQLHTQIQSAVLQVANNGQALALLIQQGNTASGLKMAQNITAYLQNVNDNLLSKLVNPNTETILKLALQAIMDGMTNVETQLTK